MLHQRKSVKPYFQPGSLSDILTVTALNNLPSSIKIEAYSPVMKEKFALSFSKLNSLFLEFLVLGTGHILAVLAYSILHTIVTRMRLPFFKIFSNFVHFC